MRRIPFHVRGNRACRNCAGIGGGSCWETNIAASFDRKKWGASETRRDAGRQHI